MLSRVRISRSRKNSPGLSFAFGTALVLALATATMATAQPPGGFGPPNRSGPFGPDGPQAKRKLVKEFDLDENGWLDRAERVPARAAAKSVPERPRRFGPPGGPRRQPSREPAQPGIRVSPHQVEQYPNATLYEPTVLRTLFLEFENEDWEQELEDFHGTDVEVPATLLVDGVRYPNVGVRFRGKSSYAFVPTGYKRSFNVSIDLADEDQRLYGYKTLNLLNSSGDASLMSVPLYSHIASSYIPVPKSNHVRVVVNGESWGVYVNVQQFDKIFVAEHYESSKGTRWKVEGSPRGDGGLRDLGEDVDEYKRRFEMKSNDGKKAWAALMQLCRTLNGTPIEDLEAALEPMLDIDETLRFLALDVALVNSDGYWTRASDYCLFLDKNKRFHVIPHDMNEAFLRGGGGPGRRGPPPGRGGFFRDGSERTAEEAGRGARRNGPSAPDSGGPWFGRGRPPGLGRPGGVDLDPFVSIDNPRMPLRSRLLAVPVLRKKYLHYIKEIAQRSLDWDNVGPVVDRQRSLIESEVAADTRKLDSFEAFQQATSPEAASESEVRLSLRAFFDQRRRFLLEYEPSP